MTTLAPATDWHPGSWQARSAAQQPAYRDSALLDEVVAQLGRLPPIVSSWEVENLKQHLAMAQQGAAFVLQGGACAERFDDCDSEVIVRDLKVLLQMSLVMMMGMRKPIIRVGRMAGQYAKPRSSDTESSNGVALPSYRGDIVNGATFRAQDREPDPTLLLRGYERSALTLNFVRSLIDGGFADLHHPENWDLDFASESPGAAEYQELVHSVTDSLAFLESYLGESTQTNRVEFYTSHEGLLLPYEQAQTRFLRHRKRWYNLTTHMPWIGMRTADPAGAHVEYFRGLANPIGVKIGTTCSSEQVLELIRILNPADEAGRLALITRFGAKHVHEHLPRVIEAVRSAGLNVLWMCDPMHGNTETTSSGYKTRPFDAIISELSAAFNIHEEMNSRLGGVHLELTGENVTECIGGARGLVEMDLARDYRTFVDPRLNYEQAMEIGLLIASRFRER